MEINSNLSAEAIFAKLDSLDSKGKDEKIEASIWNKFANIAGGKEIKYEIGKENALKSISTYLARASEEVKNKIASFVQQSGGDMEIVNNNEVSSMSNEELDNEVLRLQEKLYNTKDRKGVSYLDAKNTLVRVLGEIKEKLNQYGKGIDMDTEDVLDWLDPEELGGLTILVEKYCPENYSALIGAAEAIWEISSPSVEEDYSNYRNMLQEIGRRNGYRK